MFRCRVNWITKTNKQSFFLNRNVWINKTHFNATPRTFLQLKLYYRFLFVTNSLAYVKSSSTFCIINFELQFTCKHLKGEAISKLLSFVWFVRSKQSFAKTKIGTNVSLKYWWQNVFFSVDVLFFLAYHDKLSSKILTPATFEIKYHYTHYQ